MSCCKKSGNNEINSNGNFVNGAFIILVLYILLAIILGGILF